MSERIVILGIGWVNLATGFQECLIEEIQTWADHVDIELSLDTEEI